ncbi:MAG: hypothetical protein ACR2KQ_00360 [Actinomycetota bacterium]
MRSVGSQRRVIPVLLLLALTASLTLASPAGAGEEKETRGNVLIQGDGAFSPAQGVRSGTGTEQDPYVISNWSLNSIVIKDTDAYVVIRDNEIRNRLVLDWNGDRVEVVDNKIGDLRVNQNVKRTGDRTSGLIARNTINFVGQLRHWDGVFEDNVVGLSGAMSLPYFHSRAVNFDGFNGAKFRNNTIYGYVDVKLHGHHHGSGFGEDSHHHATEGHSHGMPGDGVDHTQRYHEVSIVGNTIYAPGRYALRWHDTAHAPDDRTNASETNPELEKPHIHHTVVRINNNELVGAGLLVDVFNAKDERHTGYAEGRIQIKGNKITVARDDTEDSPAGALHGIDVRRAQAFDLTIEANEIAGDGPDRIVAENMLRGHEAGINLTDFDEGRVTLANNLVRDFPVGIKGARFSETVHWWIKALSTENVGQAVMYDQTVSNAPHES